MGWQFTVFSLPILVALAVAVLINVYVLTAYRDRHGDPVVALYTWITVAAIVWLGFSALKLLQTDPATKLLFYRLLHVGAAALPPLLFLFVVAVTDRTRWLRPEIVGGVFLLPALFVLLLLVDPDGLIITGTRVIENEIVVLRVGDGPGFLLFSAYSTLLVVATLVLVAVETRRFGSGYYPQATLLVVATTTPMVFALLTTAGIPPFGHDTVNLVPTSATVSVVLLGLLLYRYRVVDLPPLAYATAMKYSPDVLFVLDDARTVVSTNDHGDELLDHLGGGVGSALSESLPRLDPETDTNELVTVEQPSGKRSHYRVFTERLTRGGRGLGWVVVLRDETEQQRQQERLQQMNEQLELLASTISHDLGNPLNVAQQYLRIAREESDSEELEEIDTAHARMAEIIDEVLTLARAGSQVDDLEPVPIAYVVKRAWGNVTTGSSHLSVQTDRTVMADRAMVHHVFENLFSNAVEHGGEAVTVTVGDIADGIFVEDDGVGIPPEAREDVFEVGYTDTVDGTGLGLGIVRRITNAHGWEIQVTTGSTGGARFEITGVEIAE